MPFPFQKLMELNVKTIQAMSYFKPGDLLNVKKPGDLLERNMDMFIQNTNMVLNYMKDTFDILENHWFNASLRNEEHVKEVVRQATSTAKKIVKKSASSAKAAAKKNASHAKSTEKVVAKAAPKAKTTAKKAVAKKTTQAAKTIKPAKPVVQHHTPSKLSQVANPVKHEVRTMPEKTTNELGHNLPKVGGVSEKSGIKDLGLLNKGPNIHN